MVAESEQLITVKEAAEILRVHGNTVRKYDRTGILHSVRLGPQKQRRFRKADVMALIRGDDRPAEAMG
jgi:excisionase family DNA binding protein